MPLTKEQLAEFEKLLLKWREEIISEQQKSVHDLQHQEATVMPDLADQAAAETDLTFDLRVRDREQRLLRKIDEALERIKRGEYGICENCGGDIGVRRLRARPVTTLCIDCKNEQEQQERTLGG